MRRRSRSEEKESAIAAEGKKKTNKFHTIFPSISGSIRLPSSAISVPGGQLTSLASQTTANSPVFRRKGGEGGPSLFHLQCAAFLFDAPVALSNAT